MSEAVITRCPGCRTAFRVTAEQLALREGQVRCGQCRAVFDANDHVVGKAVPKPDDATAAVTADAVTTDAATTDAATTDAVTTDAVTTDAAPASEAIHAPPGLAAPVDESVTPETPLAPAIPAPYEGDGHTRAALARGRLQEWRPRARLREQPKALYALAIVALVALLGAQALFEYRNVLAAHVPFTRPLLEAACRVASCSIAPLRDASALYIEASDLEADPAHKGLLELSATVRNRASYPIAYPYLELTLTDASDNVVARRAFAPATYAAPDAPVSGMAPNGEVLVRLFIDASATSQAGYRLYLFYP